MLEQYKDRKICIAYPSPELTDFRFNIALMELMMQNAGMLPICMRNAVGSADCPNRNILVENAKKLGITDILWVSTHCTFPINGLLKLLKHDKDIVCVTDASRRADCTLTPDSEDALIPMSLAGFSFMLIKMSVFEKIETPYFAEPPRKLLPEINVRNEEIVGEDEYFCHYARKAGFDIWCDMELSMQIGHIGSNVSYIKPAAPQPAKLDLEIDHPVEPCA